MIKILYLFVRLVSITTDLFKEVKKLIDLAQSWRRNAVKHQAHNVKFEMIEKQKTIPGNAKISIYEIIKKKSLPFSEIKLKKY